uniref:Transmembrane protein n=1 Tax=Globodera rostochiensis TaxID=31243 RepID=A0A914HBY5_GLORO
MANSSGKSGRLLRHSFPYSFRRLPLFLLLFLLLPIFCGTAQKAMDEEEGKGLEMDEHELDEGSGNAFNPDDEDDLGASGVPPPDETVEHHHHQSQTAPTSTLRPLSLPDTSAKTLRQQTSQALTPTEESRSGASPSSLSPKSSSIGDVEDGEEERLTQQFHMALLFSLVALILVAGLGAVALCCCCERRRRRTRQGRSDGYAEAAIFEQ